MSRRVVIRRFGGPEVLEFEDVPVPAPAAGEVRIRVEAAGVAFGDVMRRRGMLAPRGPFTPGYEVAGMVEAGDPIWVGRRAAVMMPKMGLGGYSEHVCVSAERLVQVPEGISAAEAVALGLNYITAWQLIHRFVGLQTGQRVLIHGAAGGVGTALLDLGKLHGLTMLGTASAGKHPILQAAGALPIDYKTEDFVERTRALYPEGVDAVFDSVGGDHLERSYRVLKPSGTLVSYGTLGGVQPGIWPLLQALLQFLSFQLRRGPKMRLYLISLSPGAGWRNCRDDWAMLLEMAADGRLHPQIGATVPFVDVQRAHAMVEQAAVPGKVVLMMESAPETVRK